MKAAFHFQGEYLTWANFHRAFYAALLAFTGRVHVRIGVGAVLLTSYAGDSVSTDAAIRDLLARNVDLWRSRPIKGFEQALRRAVVEAIVIEGAELDLLEHIDRALIDVSGFVGAYEVDESIRAHWVLYGYYISPSYRFIDGQLRFLNPMNEEVDDWIPSGLEGLGFTSMVVEETGLRYTVLDDYHSYAYARRNAFLSRKYLRNLPGDTLLRLTDLHPGLPDALYVMMRSLEQAETGDDLAGAAVTVRRFLERLADVLYPPRAAKVNGRSVGQAQCVNRILAYVDQVLPPHDQSIRSRSRSPELAGRLDVLWKLANKGVHAELGKSETSELVADLLAFTAEVLSLSAPPLDLPMAAHSKAFARFIERFVTDHRESDGRPDDGTTDRRG